MAKTSKAKTTASLKSPIGRPNSAGPAHIKTNATKKPTLTQAQVRVALGRVDISSGSALMRVARFRARTAEIDADDLLQEALVRALSTRSCPRHIAIEKWVRGIMRSIASGICSKREGDRREFEDARIVHGDLLPTTSPSPAEESARRQRAVDCQNGLDLIAKDHAVARRVIDGKGMGMRGRQLAEFAGIDAVALAAAVRLINRRAKTVWISLDLEDHCR